MALTAHAYVAICKFLDRLASVVKRCQAYDLNNCKFNDFAPAKKAYLNKNCLP